ncbi:MAG: ABC transporter ATP-binding protein [Bacillota bacterium]|nr:ABC transporter ATP-binding protein [Bacillota bacterium]
MHKIFKSAFKKHLGIAFTAIFLGIAFSVSMSYSSLMLSKLFDVIENQIPIDERLSELLKTTLLICSAFLGTIVLNVLSNRAIARYRFGMSNDLRREITQKIISSPYENFDNKNSGNYISWYTNDVDNIMNSSMVGFINVIQNSALVIAAFVALTYLNAYLGFVALGFLFLSIIVPQLFGRQMENAQKRVTMADEHYTEEVRESIGGFNVLYIANKLNIFKQSLENASVEKEKERLHLNRVSAYVEGVSILVSLVAQIGLTIVTVFLSVAGRAPLGAAFATASLSGVLFNSVGTLINDIVKFKSAKKIYEKFEISEERHEKRIELKTLNRFALEDVSMAFDEKTLFTQFNYEFQFPNKYAITGESGSGKTTLLRLLLGLARPTEGKVIVNSENLEAVEKSSLYDQVSYIDQNVFLFKGTLRDNITLWKDFDENKLLEIIDKVKLTDFINSLSGGLDTYINEGGKNISGGERQRVALARALVNQSRFVIVDETTSQLDEENAKDIESMLLTQQDFGLIMISHHFSEDSLTKFDGVVRL